MGTKGGGRSASQSSPENDDLLFLEQMETTIESTSRLHISPSNAIQREESLKGNCEEVGTPPGRKYDGTTSKKLIDEAEVSNGVHQSISRQQPTQFVSAFPPEPTLW